MAKKGPVAPRGREPDKARPAGGAGRDSERVEAQFLTSAADLRGCPPPDRPEVAVAGRSNAGKSSVLNRLTGNRNTARVSKTPGRTRLLNFFDVTRIAGQPARGRLVDLPGYGFARAGREAQARWQAVVNRFLSNRDSLAAVLLVMDIRHPLQPFDLELMSWAAASGLPLLVLLNKADKVGHGARQQTVVRVGKHLETNPEARVVAFSALTGLNVDAVLDVLQGWLDQAPGTLA